MGIINQGLFATAGKEIGKIYNKNFKKENERKRKNSTFYI